MANSGFLGYSATTSEFLRLKTLVTRMHSSRMCTARSLPYGGGLPDRDPPGQRPPRQIPPGQKHPDRDLPGQRPLGQKPLGQRPPGHVICDACWDRGLLCGQTNNCENITLPRTSSAGDNERNVAFCTLGPAYYEKKKLIIVSGCSL